MWQKTTQSLKWLVTSIIRCRAKSPMSQRKCGLTYLEHYHNPMWGHRTEDHREFWS